MFEYLYRDMNPRVALLSAIFYSFISVLLSYFLFPENASAVFPVLTTVALAPIVFREIEKEAEILEKYPHQLTRRIGYMITFYFAITVGMVVGYFLGYVVGGESVYTLQQREVEIITNIRAFITGSFIREDVFFLILSNNLRVYAITLLFSFIYGTGGVLLLAWNASILALLLYIEGPLRILGVVPHGVLEFTGYFLGGISGILTGIAVIQNGWDGRLLKAAILFFVLGIVSIVLGALVESLLL